MRGRRYEGRQKGLERKIALFRGNKRGEKMGWVSVRRTERVIEGGGTGTTTSLFEIRAGRTWMKRF